MSTLETELLAPRLGSRLSLSRVSAVAAVVAAGVEWRVVISIETADTKAKPDWPATEGEVREAADRAAGVGCVPAAIDERTAAEGTGAATLVGRELTPTPRPEPVMGIEAVEYTREEATVRAVDVAVVAAIEGAP